MTECIPSDRYIDHEGYGRIGYRHPDGFQTSTSHYRYVYAEHYGLSLQGPEMRGMQVDHLCSNRACINIDHLELVTPKVNGHRAMAGEKHWKAKLTEAEVLEVRRLCEEKVPHSALAERFGVNREAIGKIFRRETWVHV